MEGEHRVESDAFRQAVSGGMDKYLCVANGLGTGKWVYLMLIIMIYSFSIACVMMYRHSIPFVMILALPQVLSYIYPWLPWCVRTRLIG